ncbi:MAG TPA: tetratricopeptide repeat protein, partial [Ferruginibacter sp.]|nr:tetratricopeptide repeat protein [Ferruginibacter sp.]
KGNGLYQLFTNTEEVVANITNELAGMDQRSVKDDSLVNYKSYAQYFLALALILLLLELLIAEIKRRPGKLKSSLTLLLLLSMFPGFAQNEKELIKDGNDAYKKGDYPLAAASYAKAVEKDPFNPTAQYNLGNALYKTGKKEEAINAYDVSINELKKPVEKSNAYYNKGVVLQNDNKIPECITAYKAALKLDPNNEDARQNLQKALQKQKEQQQKEKDNQDKNKDDKKDKSDSPKPQPSKLTKKDAEEKLKALMQQEKNLQDKLHKVNAASVNKPEKDW